MCSCALRAAAAALLLFLATRVEVARAAEVSIDWARPTGRQATARHYGLNLYQGPRPEIAGAEGERGYREGMALMRPALVRVHRSDMLSDAAKPNAGGWVVEPEASTYRWDADKIRRALVGAQPHGPEWMINIPGWPAYLSPKNAGPDPTKHQAYAAFCAQLVKIVNQDLRLGVRYFEVLNENEKAWTGRVADWAGAYTAAARAMKAVDPTIKVGGPGFTNPWSPEVEPFIAAAAEDLDFVSYHTYQTGDRNSATPSLFTSAAGLGSIATRMKGIVAKHTRRSVELFHDEYNISWAPPDPRMNDMTGAIFDALALGSFAASELTGAMAWNEADGWYGKLDSAFRPRPAAHVFALYGAHMTGAVITSSSSAPNEVTPLAVTDGARRAIALVNRTEAAQPVRLVPTGGPDGGTWVVHQVTAGGLSKTVMTNAAIGATVGFDLPARSVTVLVSGAPEAAPDGGAVPDAGSAARDTALPDAASRDAARARADIQEPKDEEDDPAGAGASPAGCACQAGASGEKGPGGVLLGLGLAGLACLRRRRARCRGTHHGR